MATTVKTSKAKKAVKAVPKRSVRRVTPEATELPDDLSGRAAHSTLAATPLIGIRAADLKRAAGIFAGAMLKQPRKVAKHLGSYAKELGRVAAGTSETQGDPKDRRFADPAWQSSPLHRRLLQAYLATGRGLNQFIDDTDLDAKDKERARFLVSLIVDGIAPSNTLLNPAALKKIVDTGGKSLVAGIKNLVHDIRENRGMPSMVDRSSGAARQPER